MCGIIGYVATSRRPRFCWTDWPGWNTGVGRFRRCGGAVETKGLQVYKSKGRLQVLSDTVIHGGADGRERWASAIPLGYPRSS